MVCITSPSTRSFHLPASSSWSTWMACWRRGLWFLTWKNMGKMSGNVGNRKGKSYLIWKFRSFQVLFQAMTFEHLYKMDYAIIMLDSDIIHHSRPMIHKACEMQGWMWRNVLSWFVTPLLRWSSFMAGYMRIHTQGIFTSRLPGGERGAPVHHRNQEAP